MITVLSAANVGWEACASRWDIVNHDLTLGEKRALHVGIINHDLTMGEKRALHVGFKWWLCLMSKLLCYMSYAAINDGFLLELTFLREIKRSVNSRRNWSQDFMFVKLAPPHSGCQLLYESHFIRPKHSVTPLILPRFRTSRSLNPSV